jgi:predicted nucleic acid-binding protein
MIDAVVLDSGPLGMISHPRASAEIVQWLARLVGSGVEVLIPEVADYEVRRELLRAGRERGIERLDSLRESLSFVPISSDAMLRAAAFWADARRRGRPTASDQSLDADAILAGQAATVNRSRVIVASNNPRHIARFVPAQRWQEISAQK